MGNTYKRFGPLSASGTGGGFATGYVMPFLIADWVPASGDWNLAVLATTHGRGINPTVQVYELDGGVYTEVLMAVNVDNLGNVSIAGSQVTMARFDGKIIIS